MVTGNQAFFLGLLLLVTAAGKSAMIPFSGWLPRAMEGPTPSSAIFYGALSVHLGVFLLLRFSPMLDLSPAICAIVVAVGLLTAIYGAFVSRVQTDIKSALSFASLTQVGLITAEVGMGLRYLALIHMIGHACLRTLQFVRAPSVLQDYQLIENALSTRLPPATDFWQRLLNRSQVNRFYRAAIARGYLDEYLKRFGVRPVLSLFEVCDELDQRWYRLLAGRPPISTPASSHSAVALEEAP
jgi:NAD(P)H-quinone oxidoreductase subunit 5